MRVLTFLVTPFGAVCCLIGCAHNAFGPRAIVGAIPVNATMDSEDRFFGTLFLGFRCRADLVQPRSRRYDRPGRGSGQTNQQDIPFLKRFQRADMHDTFRSTSRECHKRPMHNAGQFASVAQAVNHAMRRWVFSAFL